MSNIVIRTQGLDKIYRLYRKPHYRFLDMFGLLRQNNGYYTEHPALNDVSLTISRGEKVAIVGRNGAGKSTLLKLISKIIEPTSGHISVHGKVHALLSIGAGFHPDFTGRENVYSYLEHLGLSEKDAHGKVEEIIEFAEIHEYIDQPIKTYSTGMGARLMFATSTAITPDLLALDEILGVGDAYFVQKSYDKMKQMCESKGTTLLFVTHDLYSAANLCERCIWLENGRVLMDMDAKTVIGRYEASIRDQQEERLRKLKMSALNENIKEINGESANGKQNVKLEQNTFRAFAQIRCNGNLPIDKALPIKSLKILNDNKCLAELYPGNDQANSSMELLIDAGEGNWGPEKLIDGCKTRSFEPFGSIYHRVPFLLTYQNDEKFLDSRHLAFEIEYKDEASTPCLVEIFYPDGGKRLIGDIVNKGSGQWVKKKNIFSVSESLEKELPKKYRYGNQAFSITDISFINNQNEESFTFFTCDSIKIRMNYIIRDPEFCEKPVIQLNFLKDGITRTHRFTIEDQLFDYSKEQEGELLIEAKPLLLCQGTYFINIAVMREGGYRRDEIRKFFTVNENLLDQHSRAYQIEILPANNILVDDCIFTHPVTWYKNGVIVSEGIYPKMQNSHPGSTP